MVHNRRVNALLTVTGLTLSKNIEKGLDNCRIVFVPEIDERSREVKWKIVLTNKWWRNQTLVGNEKWQVTYLDCSEVDSC